MALYQIVLTLVVLLALVAGGSGEFNEHIPRFVPRVLRKDGVPGAAPIVAPHHGALCVGIWLTLLSSPLPFIAVFCVDHS